MCLDVKAMSKIASAAAVAQLRVVTSGVSPRRLHLPLTHLATTSQELGRIPAMWIQHMQKALNEMNLHLHHVLSDISGRSGLAILDAILAGERDPKKLASLADRRVEKSQAQIEAALTGDYRPELLFVLSQSLHNYRQMQEQIAQCDLSIEKQLAKNGRLPKPQTRPQSQYKHRKIRRVPSHARESQRCLGIKLGRASQAYPRSRSNDNPWIEHSRGPESAKRDRNQTWRSGATRKPSSPGWD